MSDSNAAAPSAVFHACLADAVAHSGALMQGLVASARDALLLQRSRQGLQLQRRGVVGEMLHLLTEQAAFLVERFPAVLEEAVREDMLGEAKAPAPPQELSLVDDAELEDAVELARSQQAALQAVEGALAEFDSLICAAQGLGRVQPQRNMLRPAVYTRALQTLVRRTAAAADARSTWMLHLSAALGENLAQEYRRLSAFLQQAGVQPVGYVAVPQAPAPPPGNRDVLYTEERRLLAARIAAEIDRRPEMRRVPEAVRSFVCGPWSEVIAAAQLAARGGPVDPDGYAALVPPLLWSVQPDLGRTDPGRLKSLSATLFPLLRAGLASIGYPELQAQPFFEALVELHRIGLRSPGSSFAPRQDVRGLPAVLSTPGETAAVPAPPTPATGQGEALAPGVWVSLLQDGQWQRLHLTWASPRGSLLLFTHADGRTESMTRRLCLERMAAQQLRIVEGPSA
ncbi:DUF1631 family protein [Xylophilus sp. GW821-FHT01B05]